MEVMFEVLQTYLSQENKPYPKLGTATQNSQHPRKRRSTGIRKNVCSAPLQAFK